MKPQFQRICLVAGFAALFATACENIEEQEYSLDPQVVSGSLTCQSATVAIQQGLSGYSGTQDTEIRQKSPTKSYASNTSISVNKNTGSANQQGLMRFDGIFGSGANQIPTGVVIVSATLELRAIDPSGNTISIHRMLKTWQENTTWNAMSGGVSADNVEALSLADDALMAPGSGAFYQLDVTDSVAAWQTSPSSNFGWVMRNNGSDGWDFNSSEHGTVSRRPRLLVTYCTAPDPCAGITCDQPPTDVCVSSSTLRQYDALGTCEGGQCDYTYVDVFCAGGCVAGVCEGGDLQGNMIFWFGNLHSHTSNSDGSGTPSQGYAWARDTVGFDFYVVTDHAEQVSSSEWTDTKNQANNHNQDGTYVAIHGFEWSSSNGHINVFNTSDYTSANSTPSVSGLYSWVNSRGALAQFNHPGREPNLFNDLSFVSSVRDNFFAIETGNKGDGNNDGEYLAYFHYALDKGWRVAPTSNQDNHSLSANSHRTVIITEDLTRSAILDAMAARRLYSSDDPNMEVIFKQGADWMGAELPLYGQQVTFDIEVTDDESILAVELRSNGGAVVRELIPAAGTTHVRWQPTVNATGDYYYVQVTEADTRDRDGPKQIAVTAPIWIY